MQELIVFLIVGAAAIYLGWMARDFWRGKGGCNGCGNASKKLQEAPLVQITLNGRASKK